MTVFLGQLAKWLWEQVARLWRRSITLERGDLQIILNHNLLTGKMSTAYLLRDGEPVECIHGHHPAAIMDWVNIYGAGQ